MVGLPGAVSSIIPAPLAKDMRQAHPAHSLKSSLKKNCLLMAAPAQYSPRLDPLRNLALQKADTIGGKLPSSWEFPVSTKPPQRCSGNPEKLLNRFDTKKTIQSQAPPGLTAIVACANFVHVNLLTHNPLNARVCGERRWELRRLYGSLRAGMRGDLLRRATRRVAIGDY